MAQKYGYLHVVQAIHGDCLMLEYDIEATSTSGFMLIDGGPSQAYKRTSNNLGTPVVNTHGTTDHLFTLLNDLSTRATPSRQLQVINTAVLTHDDQDHKNGIADLFRYLLGDIPGSWNNGLTLMGNGQLPIENIWYNSQANMMDQFLSTLNPRDRKKKPAVWGWNDQTGNLERNGWFDTLLERYNGKFPTRSKSVVFNEEFQSSNRFTPQPGVHLVAENSRKAYMRPVVKGQFTFRIIGPSYTGDLMKQELITELVVASRAEYGRVSNSGARRNRAGGAPLTAATTSSSKDHSAKNRSSIAFVATDPSTASPANPSDSTKLIMLGDAVIASQIEPGEYTIMKVAHHGSGHNSYLSQRNNPLSYTQIRISSGTLRNAFAFFTEVRAKKYVISASPTEGSSNPHITTILGIYLAIVELRLNDPRRPAVDVYLTNDLPRNTLQGFSFFLSNPSDTQYTGSTGNLEYALWPGKNPPEVLAALDINHFDDNMRIWKLNVGAAYGTIPIYDPIPPASMWTRFDRGELLRAAQSSNTPRTVIDKPARKSTGGLPPPPSKRRK